MKLIKKFAIFVLLVFLTACDDLDGMCYSETDYGNSGDFDTVAVTPGNSVCNYNLLSNITNFEQSSNVVQCLGVTNVSSAYSAGGLTEEQQNNIKSGSVLCNAIADDAFRNGYTKESYNNEEGFFTNEDSYSTENKKLIISKLFNGCVEVCVSACESENANEDKWTKANIKTGDNYLGINLTEKTVMRIKATGEVSLTDSVASSNIEFKKTGTEDVYRGLNTFLKNGDLADITLKINKSEASSSASLSNFKSRTYFGFKEYNSSLSSDAIGTKKHYYQEPDYSAVFCDYMAESARCEFDYLKIINDGGLSSSANNFISKLDDYYNLNYPTMVFNSLENEQYVKYVGDSFNYITYDHVSNSLKTADEDVVIGNVDKTTSVIKNGVLDGYVWNDSNDSYTFVVKGPFKLAIKYLDTKENVDCKYTISYGDYVLTESNGRYMGEKNDKITLNVSYKKDGKGDYVWKTIKYVTGSTEDDGSAKVENIFNRYSTVDKQTETNVTIRNVGNKNGNVASCSRGLAIKVLNLRDYKLKRSGLMFFAMPGVNINSNIYYKLINPDSLTTSGGSITLTDKLRNFFETYSVPATKGEDSGKDDSMVYRGMKVVTDTEVASLSKTAGDTSIINTTNNLIASNKIAYVRKGQQIRFDYSNWMEIDGLKDIKIKKASLNINNSTTSSGTSTIETYLGTGLNVFIKEEPAYICYGTAEESIDMQVKCGEERGRYSNFEYVDNKNQTKQASVCFIEEKNNCYASAMLIKEYTISFPDKDKPDQELIDAYNNPKMVFNPQPLTTFAAKVVADYYKYDDLLSFYPESDDVDKKAEREAAINESKMLPNRHTKLYSVLENTYNQVKKCYNAINEGYTYYIGMPDSDGYEDYRKSLTNISYGNKDVIIVKGTNDTNIPVIGVNGDLYNFVGVVNDSDKKLVYDAIAKRISELLQINKSSDSDNKTTSYVSNFYYYKNICKKTDSGNCEGQPVLQCYDLSTYKGSTKLLLDRIKSNKTATESDIKNYGNLTAMDRAFGAKKIFEYNGSSGLIKNFNAVDNDPNDTSFLSFKYDNNIVSNGLNFYSTYVINEINYNGSYGDTIRNFMKPEIKSSPIIKIESETRNSYQNGDMLAVILGENDKIYYSSNEAGEKDSIYYDSVRKIPVNEEGDGNGNNRIFKIVSYNSNGNLDEGNTRYKFDVEGNLVKYSNNSLGFLFEEDSNKKAADYLSYGGDDNYKNVFFKIVDVDDKLENNTGKYTVVINTFSAGESEIISYFKDFFNKILSFIDGSYFKLKLEKGTFKSCTSYNKNECFIYNEEDVSENGNGCSVGDNNNYCFEECYSGDYNNNTICKEVYDGKGFVKNIFDMFVNDPLYQFIAKISLVLAITLYGFTYFFGLSNFTQSEITKRILRYAFIYMIISPTGWNFFNDYIIRFFKDGVDSLLFLIASAFDTDVNSSLYEAYATGSLSDKSMLFSSTFTNLELIFSEAIFNKMLGLAFSGWFGFIYLYLVLSAVLNYMVGAFTAIILYLSAQLYMSLVFCFFPLVLLFMFFERTKKTFDNWIGMLIGFAGQQLFLITTLSFFNLLVLTYIKMTFTYRVCLLPILNLNLGGIPLAAIMFWKIPSASFSNSLNIMDENLPNFYTIISFYIITVLMGKFITGMVEVGKTIFGGIGIGEGVAQTLTNGINKASNLAKSTMKDLGSEFGKGMAKRFLGGQAIENYADKQQKERENRRKRREDYFKNHRKDIKDGMDKFKGSKEFAKQHKELSDKKTEEGMAKLREDKKYQNASEDKKRKMEQEVRKKADRDAATEILRDKEKELSYNTGVDRIMREYGNELNDISMKETGKKFEDLSPEQQREMAGRYGVRQGLINDYKKRIDGTGTPPPPPPPPGPDPKPEPVPKPTPPPSGDKSTKGEPIRIGQDPTMQNTARQGDETSGPANAPSSNSTTQASENNNSTSKQETNEGEDNKEEPKVLMLAEAPE